MVQIRIFERFSMGINGGAAKFLLDPGPGHHISTSLDRVLPRWKFPGVAYRRTLPAAIVFAPVKFSIISAAFPDPLLAFGPFSKILLNLIIPLLTGAGAGRCRDQSAPSRATENFIYWLLGAPREVRERSPNKREIPNAR